MTGWEVVLAYAVGPGAIALGGWVIAARTAKVSTRAAEKTAVVQEKADAVTGYHTLVADLRDDIERLRADLEALSQRHQLLTRHVGKLEQQAARDKSVIRGLINYAKLLRAELRRHQITVPEPPSGLDLDDPLEA